MQNETLTVGDITATVRSRSRRTAIIEARYKQALMQAHPEIGEYEQAQFALVKTSLPVDESGRVKRDLTLEQAAAFDEYTRQSVMLQHRHLIGSAYAEEVIIFVPMLARITSLIGTAFDLGMATQFSDAQVCAAFEDWIDADEGGFWSEIFQAVQRVDTPLTSIVQQPPGALTEAQQADPLSEVPADDGSKKSSGEFSPSSSANGGKKRQRIAKTTTASITH